MTYTVMLFALVAAFYAGWRWQEKYVEKAVADAKELRERAERAEAVIAAVDESDSSLVSAIEDTPGAFLYRAERSDWFNVYRHPSDLTFDAKETPKPMFTVRDSQAELSAPTLREAWQKLVRFRAAMKAAESQDGAA